MAIYKDRNYKNKYLLRADSTNGDFQRLIAGKDIRCIICNANTAVNFQGRNVTVNNNMLDGIFYINRIC